MPGVHRAHSGRRGRCTWRVTMRRHAQTWQLLTAENSHAGDLHMPQIDRHRAWWDEGVSQHVRRYPQRGSTARPHQDRARRQRTSSPARPKRLLGDGARRAAIRRRSTSAELVRCRRGPTRRSRRTFHCRSWRQARPHNCSAAREPLAADRAAHGDAGPRGEATSLFMFADAAEPIGDLIFSHNTEAEPLVVRRVPCDVGVGGQR